MQATSSLSKEFSIVLDTTAIGEINFYFDITIRGTANQRKKTGADAKAIHKFALLTTYTEEGRLAGRGIVTARLGSRLNDKVEV